MPFLDGRFFHFFHRSRTPAVEDAGLVQDPPRDQSDWAPYGARGDEVCEATITLRDNRKNEDDLVIRVVGRRRKRTGKVSWYATPVPKEELDGSAVLDAYFAR